ncbi:MAG: CocE/NonD family hydrolase [Polyangiaceae bacterium]|nr:CocE/NonD family hydrolase [Polyangiaceae bacterium]
MLKRGIGLCVATTLAFGCSDSDTTGGGGAGGEGAGVQGGGGEGGGAPAAPFSTRGSVEQVHVWKAEPNTRVELRSAGGDVVSEGTTDELGSYIFRKVAPGDGYSVHLPDLSPPEEVGSITVLSVDGSKPDQSFYDEQKLQPGYGYLTTRDGTQLAVYVTLPGPAEEGPYPTVVNYSGYDPAKPGEPIPGYEGLCGDYPVLCDKPTDPSAFFASLMGYATVSVNMRGTGCSGGAYDYFEDLQLLDGYDVVETVAAQDWVSGHHVGMTGLSYPGITQMFVASMKPPSLAAITPLSVIGGTYSTARPGGLFNNGFALSWISNVLDKAAPYGQGWEQARVDAGDTVCEENQLLHGQRVNVIDQAQNTPYYDDDLVGRVDPTKFADKIEVPVFLASAWQDEQTGPFFFTLLDRFTSAPVKRFTTYNGVHVDGFSPEVLVEWKTFLDLYVAERVPSVDPGVRTLIPVVFQQVFGVNMQLRPDRLADQPSWEVAKTVYEAEPQYRTIFERGGTEDVGAPIGTFELTFDGWPHPDAEEHRFYLQPNGDLVEAQVPVVDDAGFSFTLDPEAGQRGILAPGGDIWALTPEYQWNQPAAGSAVVMTSAPLSDDVVMLGSGSVDIWIRSAVDDADLEVNLSEIRPDGQEMFVQSGWLRASVRALDGSATDLWPEHTYREEDEALLVPGEWTLARVGIAAFSHVFRAGSRIRVSIDTPGDSRAEWKFELKEFDEPVSYDVGASTSHPTSVVLPMLSGTTGPGLPLPACPSLRGQQCRTFMPYTNVPSMP